MIGLSRVHRVFVLIVIGVLGMLFSGCKTNEGYSNFSGYNVLFVSFDALQASHTSCLGYFRKTTPNIDKFAKEGFLFKQAIAQASWTLPSSMSWFTSLYPSEHKLLNKYSTYTENEKVLSDLSKLSPGVITLAEVLKKEGYATGAFTGDAGVSAKFGFGKGFDIYVDDAKFAGFDHSIPAAVKWIKENKDKKLFIFLHGYDSHGQYDPPAGYTRKFLDFKYRGQLKGGKEEQGRFREEGLENGSIQLSDEDARFWRALYDEKISDADAKFGDFIEELKNLGLFKKTIIILTADHGTEFYEHKRFDHGFSLYEELIHVPLVIYLPGEEGGRVINDQARSIDLMPTILDLLKIKVSDEVKSQMRGVSLKPALEGRYLILNAFSETDYRLFTHKRSIRTPDGWKLIYTLESDQKELYNLNNDPAEQRNLIGVERRKAYELEQELFSWLKSIQKDFNSYRHGKETVIKEY